MQLRLHRRSDPFGEIYMIPQLNAYFHFFEMADPFSRYMQSLGDLSLVKIQWLRLIYDWWNSLKSIESFCYHPSILPANKQ